MTEATTYTLHDAAKRLHEIDAEVEQMMKRTDELERDYHARDVALPDGPDAEALRLETGWGPFYDAVDSLGERLNAVDRLQSELHGAFFEERLGLR